MNPVKRFKKAMADKEEVERVFKFKFPTCTTKQEYELEIPIKIPHNGSVKELTHRVMLAFKLPCYVENDLLEKLEITIKQWTLEYHDEKSDLLIKAAQNGELDIDDIIKSWEKTYKQKTIAYAEPLGTTDEELFAAAYHRLVHSPSLETILQAEHEFGRAVTDVVQQRDAEFEKLTQKFVYYTFQSPWQLPNCTLPSSKTYLNLYL